MQHEIDVNLPHRTVDKEIRAISLILRLFYQSAKFFARKIFKINSFFITELS